METLATPQLLTSLHLFGKLYITVYIVDKPTPIVNREIAEKFPHLRQTICKKLIQALGEIKSSKVFRGVLWILGEYVESLPDIQSTLQEIRKVLGEIPILASEQRLLDEANGGEEAGADADADGSGKKDEKLKDGGGRPRVLADGTYATESAYTSTTTARLEAVKAAAKPPLRSEFLSLLRVLQIL